MIQNPRNFHQGTCFFLLSLMELGLHPPPRDCSWDADCDDLICASLILVSDLKCFISAWYLRFCSQADAVPAGRRRILGALAGGGRWWRVVHPVEMMFGGGGKFLWSREKFVVWRGCAKVIHVWVWCLSFFCEPAMGMSEPSWMTCLAIFDLAWPPSWR